MLLNTVEAAMNEIWGVHRPRTIVRKLTDYAAILFVLPMCLVLAASASRATGALSSDAHLRPILDLAPIGAVAIGLFFLYTIMPNTRVRVWSAALGAVVGAALFYSTLLSLVAFQVGVARYNILYAGFAAVPLFLMWVFVAWMTVLFGAWLAAAHQDEEGFRFRLGHVDAGFAVRTRVGLGFITRITRAFLDGTAAPTLSELAEAAGVADALAREVLGRLEQAGLTAAGGGAAATGPWLLTRDPDTTHVLDVLDALAGQRGAQARAPVGGDEQHVRTLLEGLREATEQSPSNATLRELVRDATRREGGQPSPGRTDHGRAAA